MSKLMSLLKFIFKVIAIFAKKLYTDFMTAPKKIKFIIIGFLITLILLINLWPQTIPATEAIKEMELLAGNIRRAYQHKPDYWGLNNAIILDKKIYPNKMAKNGKLISVLGNEVLVGDGVLGKILMPGSQNFDIVYAGLTKKQCVRLASFEYDHSFWLMVMGITIADGDDQQLFSWEDKNHKLPISTNDAKKFCKDGSSIIWHND